MLLAKLAKSNCVPDSETVKAPTLSAYDIMIGNMLWPDGLPALVFRPDAGTEPIYVQYKQCPVLFKIDAWPGYAETIVFITAIIQCNIGDGTPLSVWGEMKITKDDIKNIYMVQHNAYIGLTQHRTRRLYDKCHHPVLDGASNACGGCVMNGALPTIALVYNEVIAYIDDQYMVADDHPPPYSSIY
jgi:hypothetical protein